MQSIHSLINQYGESHQNGINKLIHWVCVPSIVFSLFGLLYSIPFFTEKTMFLNWAAIALLGAMIYYLRLSIPLAVGFLFVCIAVLWGNTEIYEAVGRNSGQLAEVSLIIFVVAWIGQFIGHKIEGKKPSFIDDLQFLLIGPAWLLHFIYTKLGIKY